MKHKFLFSFICIILVLVLSLSSLVVSVSANVEINNPSAYKTNAILNEKMQLALDGERIPVYIWYADIDQHLVEETVKEDYGLSLETIRVDYEMPSSELITAYKNGEEDAKKEMNEYFERTKDNRDKEKELTDKYVLSRRDVSMSKYSQKSSKIISDLNIDESNITFNSSFAPAIVANLTVSEIERLKTDNRIEEIGYFIPVVGYDLSITEDSSVDNLLAIEREASGISKANDVLGLTGNNVKVGMMETGCPDTDNASINGANITVNNENAITDHALNTSRIIVGDSDGIAKNAQLYSVSNPEEIAEAGTFDYTQFEWLLSQGVSVINLSHNLKNIEQGYNLNYTYYFTEKWIDHLVSYHNVTVVVASGNDGDKPNSRIGSPGLAHNVITVGGYITNFTATTSDDFIAPYSSWSNSGGGYYGLEKPDVIMPSQATNSSNIGSPLSGMTNTNGLVTNGTSWAAPMLTGSIALMLELKPSLSAYPQAIKAIVMASCHRKVASSPYNEPVETIGQGITERQGAGAPDVWTMACIVSQGTYGTDVLSGTQQTHRFVQPKYGATKMNISMCWLRENAQVNEGTSDRALLIGPYINLDLSVKYNGVEKASSAKEHSSTEMAYFSLGASNNMYEFTVNRNSTYTDEVRYGYAYSTNNTYYTQDARQGIYRIKNLDTKEYLTLNTSTNQLMMQPYSSTNTKQEWIIQNSPTGAYNLKSAYGSTQGIANYGSVIDSNSKTVMLGSETLNFSIFEGGFNVLTDDYSLVRFYTRTGPTEWFIGCDADKAIIASNISSSKKSCWILEEINYRRGDVDLDGDLDTNDESCIQRYIAGTYTFNNKQLYLADVNDDGRITTADSTKIQKIRLGVVEF